MRLARTRLGVVLAAATIAITGSITVITSPAYAEDDRDEGGHCVGTMPETDVKCFPTQEEADKYVDSVSETVPDDDSRRQGGQAFRVEASATAQFWPVLIFRGYDFEFYRGGTLTVIGLNGPCSWSFADVDYQLDLTRIFGGRWNNDISSYRDYSVCWTRLYDGAFFTGAFRGYLPDSPTLGVFNNRASSIRWT
jgi:hypothetical protein